MKAINMECVTVETSIYLVETESGKKSKKKPSQTKNPVRLPKENSS